MGIWRVFKCIHCEYTGERDTNDLKFGTPLCPHCLGKMILVEDDEAEDNALASHLERLENEDINELIPDYMQHKSFKKQKKKETPEILEMVLFIAKLGNDNMWERIERHDNPSFRIRERDLFFKAGGVCPKKDIF